MKLYRRLKTLRKDGGLEKLKFFQSVSEREKVGHRVLNSTRSVFLFYFMILLSSFLVGTGIASQVSDTKAASTFRISTSGNDSNPCTSSQPCLTMNRAYQVASPGDTVEMAGGSYSTQTIQRDGAKSGPSKVIFKPVAGANVSVNFAFIQASYIEIRDITMRFEIETANSSTPKTTDVTLRNIDATGTQNQVQTAKNVQLINVEMGVINSTIDGLKIQPQFNDGTTADEPTNVVLDGVQIHDMKRTDTSSHVDCLQIGGAVDLTIKNSKFWHCMTQGVFLKEFNGVIDNVVVENNWFGPCTTPNGDSNNTSCTQGLILDDGISNITVRYNSFGSTAGLRTQTGVGTSNMRVYGNLGSKPGCFGSATVTYAYNVWQPGGSACSSTDAVASSASQLGFTADPSSGASFDLHINAGSIARNFIPASFSPPDGRANPSTDFDGQSRPIDTNYDAGADEYGSGGGSPPPVPSAPVVTISASPSSMQSGNSSTLNWSATNSPSSCTASGDWSGSKSASGSQSTGNLSTVKTYNYALACSNAGGSDSASATVNVTATPPPPPDKPVVSMSVSPSTVNQGSSSTIAWSATNSPSSCTASGDWSGNKSASGSQGTGKLNSVKTYTYSLNCTNAGGSTSVSVALVVVPVKPTVKISLSPDIINEGQSSTITWSTTNSPTNCSTSGDWSGDKSTSGGSETTGAITGATSKTYNITCSNTGGSASDSVTLSISTPEAPIDTSVPKPTVKLSAKPSTVESGQQATLTWKTGNNPSSCTASEGWGGDKDAKGGNENTESLSEGKTYVITCTNAGGSTSDSVSVSVVTIDENSGEVKVNNQVVPDLKVDDPSIVGEAKAGEKPLSEDIQNPDDSSSVVASTTGFLDTTSGKLTFAGLFAGLVTTVAGGLFYLKHHFAIRLLPAGLFKGKDGGSGDGPIDMISG